MDDLSKADCIVRQREPFAAEPLPRRLIERYLTPQSPLYIRSHGAIPLLVNNHAICVGGKGLCDTALTLAELKARFPHRRIGGGYTMRRKPSGGSSGGRPDERRSSYRTVACMTPDSSV